MTMAKVSNSQQRSKARSMLCRPSGVVVLNWLY